MKSLDAGQSPPSHMEEIRMSERYSDLVELKALEANELVSIVGGKNGADDPAGHVRGGRKPKAPKAPRNPDGPNHT